MQSISAYLTDPADVYRHFNFYRGTLHTENKVDPHTTVFKACAVSDIQSRFIIKVQRFQESQVPRFLTLAKAVDSKLVLASKVFLERDEEDGWLQAHVVEPSPETSACETLASILKSGNLTYAQRQTIFRNLVDAVLELHRLGAPHLELSPSTVLLETKSLVYLRPFSIGAKVQSDYYWYNAPEELLLEHSSSPACDVWALGCIFAEMFVSLTPLFQSISPLQKLTKMFEVLGAPDFAEVADYMPREVYEEARSAITPESATGGLLLSLNDQERRLLLAMLQFRPGRRKSLEDIQSLCTPYVRAYKTESPMRFVDQVTTGPYEFNEQSRSGLSSAKSSIALSRDAYEGLPFTATREGRRAATSLDRQDYQTAEEETFGRQSVSSLLSDPSPKAAQSPLSTQIPLQYHPEKRDSLNLRIRASEKQQSVGEQTPLDSVDIDNTLTVSILCAKNLHVYKYVHELEGALDYHISFTYELDSRGAGSVMTPAYPAGEKVTIGHSQEFHINSDHFRLMHRHQPIVITMLQGTSERCEDVLGVCEVYLGLLFSSLGDGSCVHGWYHILPSNSQVPIGQLEVEVKTRLPITRSVLPMDKKSRSSPERTASKSEQKTEALSSICAGLDQLTSNLLRREKTPRKEDTTDFAVTLQQLRRLVFDEK